MSKEELEKNLNLLENLHNFGQQALIEADKIEYLCEDGSWKTFDTLGLSLVPILIYTKRHISKDNSSIIYELAYELLMPTTKIEPYYIEQIELKNNHQKDRLYSKNYHQIENKNLDENSIKIKYDNTKINTFFKVKSQEKMKSFKCENEHLLISSAETVKKSILFNLSKQKIVK